MKRSILITVVMLLILSIATSVNAYSTSDYSIDVPDSFKNVTIGAYAKDDGTSFNIQTSYYNEKNGDPFTQRNLDDLVNKLYTEIDSQRDELKKQMKSQYGTKMSSKDIEKYVDSFKCNSIDVKEITKCTKNGYKCFHILANYSMGDYDYYCDQYSVVSGNKMYVLTLSALNKEDLNSEEMKGIVDSFTIKNYKEPKGNGISPTLIGAIVGAAIGGIMGIVASIKKKKENATNVNVNVTQNVVETEKAEENTNTVESEDTTVVENKEDNKEEQQEENNDENKE